MEGAEDGEAFFHLVIIILRLSRSFNDSSQFESKDPGRAVAHQRQPRCTPSRTSSQLLTAAPSRREPPVLPARALPARRSCRSQCIGTAGVYEPPHLTETQSSTHVGFRRGVSPKETGKERKNSLKNSAAESNILQDEYICSQSQIRHSSAKIRTVHSIFRENQSTSPC